MNKKYFFGPNSPAGRQGQEKVGEKRRIEEKTNSKTKTLQFYDYFPQK